MMEPLPRSPLPPIVRIGRDNSTFQLLSALRSNRTRRHQTRTFVVEGVEPITAAMANGWECEAVIYESRDAISAWAAGIIDESPAAAVRYEVTRPLLERLSGKTTPSELVAVFRMRADSTDRIPLHTPFVAVVFDRPSNHGNLGSLIRSCEAFGARGVVLSGHGVDLYDPATITASRGAMFAMPVVRVPSAAEVIAWLGRVRGAIGACALVGVETDGDRDLWAHDFRTPTVLVAGSEREGLSRAYRDACDALLRIPMAGSVSSINVSVATSIALYEVARQRK